MVVGIGWLVSTTWFAWLQSPHPNASMQRSLSSAAWWWHPLERNPSLRVADLPSVTLQAVCWAGDGRTAWAVGAQGVVLHTRDAGRSWRLQTNIAWPEPAAGFPEAKSRAGLTDRHPQVFGQSAPNSAQQSNLNPNQILEDEDAEGPRPRLEAVHFFDTQSGWAVGGQGTILSTQDGGERWTGQVSGTLARLRGVQFVNAQTGWVVSEDGEILQTRDGGNTWSMTSGQLGSGRGFSAVTFAGERKGWVVGEYGTLLATSDGGETFRPQVSGNSQHLQTVFFLNEQRGWVAGNAGTLLRTEDGGSSWQPLVGNNDWGTIRSLRFQDERMGWMIEDIGGMWRTRDGGLTWDPVPIPEGMTWRGMDVDAAGRGLAVGDRGAVLRLDAQSHRWVPASRASDPLLRAVSFSNPQVGWVLGEEGVLLRTQDGGRTWLPQWKDRTRSWYALQFVDAQHGWVVGEGGAILHTADGGRSWTTQVSGTEATLRSVHFQNALNGWVVGSQEVLLLTQDGGRTWVPAKGGPLRAVHFPVGQTGWAVGDEAIILRSEDGGRQWWVQHEGPGPDLTGVWFLDERRGWAVGDREGMWWTEDAGETWEERFADGPGTWLGIRFTDTDHGWVVGSGGRILWTQDGGRNWQPASSGTGVPLMAVDFTDVRHGWAVGGGGTIRSTRDGGRTWQDPRVYRRYPAPIYWVVLGLLGLVLMPALWPPKPVVQSEARSVADQYLSDKPLEPGEAAGKDLVTLAGGLSNYLRNRNTGAPLVLAVTGAWGSGKSSLMNLLRGDLSEKGFHPVWFNAWHHQQEEHLLAALLENIRSQAIPPLWKWEGCQFRARLLYARYQRRWWITLLGLAGAMFAGTWFFRQDWTGMEWSGLETLIQLLPLGTAAVPVVVLWKMLSAFGVDPARLVVGSEGRGKVAEARALTSFRYRFAQEFGEVTGALRPLTMVVFIDDLDRCRPEHMMTVLESVNFLTSSGDCFIVIGMEERAVLDCLSTQLEWRQEAEDAEGAEETEHQCFNPRDPSPGVTMSADQATRETPLASGLSTGPIPGKDASPEGATTVTLSRRNYAQLWLEKLVQVRIPIPPMSVLEAQSLATGSAGESRFAEKEPTTESDLDRLARWFQPWLVRLAALMSVVGVLGLGAWLGTLPPNQAPAAKPKVEWMTPESWLTNLVLVGHLTDSHLEMRMARPSTTGVETASLPESTPIKPVARAPQAGSNEGTEAPRNVVPASTPGNAWWAWVGIVGLAFLFGAIHSLRQRIPVAIEDSEDFRDAVRDWWPLIEKKCRTPRAIKRFLNRLRFYAMLVRDPQHPAAKPSLGERAIVGFGVLEHCRPDVLQRALMNPFELWKAEVDFQEPKLQELTRALVADMTDEQGRIREQFQRLVAAGVWPEFRKAP